MGGDMTSDSHGTSMRGMLDACIHCGLCLSSCPTYRETGDEASSPRGRIYLIRALEEGRLQPSPEVNEHLDGCVGCRACETACPAGVRYGALLELARDAYVEPARPAGMRTRFWRPLLRQVLPFRDRMAFVTLPGQLAKKALLKAGKAPGWLPPALARPLELLPDRQPAPPPAEWTPAVGEEKGVVAFLAGCAMPALYPRANGATVRMLARAGYRVWTPNAAGCCGAVHLHDGDLSGAKAMARTNVAAFEQHEVVAIVGNAAGCGAALHEYGDLLADDPAWAERAQQVAAKAIDFAKFLDQVGMPVPPPSAKPQTVTWHDPCHLAHGQGVRAEPRRLLAALPGVKLVELPEADWCCGGAGSYTLLQPVMADKLLAHKVRHIRETGAEVLVTANPPCLMQIGRGLALDSSPARIVHLAEYLDSFWP